MEQEQCYTLSVFTENKFGLLNRITILLTRRRINIESICVSESEIPGIHRYTLVLKLIPSKARKLREQVQKVVDVLAAFIHSEPETHRREIALFKLANLDHLRRDLEESVRKNQGTVLEQNPAFILVEKTGNSDEIRKFYEKIRPFGILEYANSGSVAISIPMKPLNTYLQEQNN